MIDLLKKVCQMLDKNNIHYMLSGSLALNFYTIPRMTRDIDFVIKLKNEDVDNFVNMFENNFYCYKPSIEEAIQTQGMFNLIDLETNIKLDFIICKNNEYRQYEFERRIKNKMLGFDTWIVSIEDLIISKIIWIQELQSEKQMEDIKSLLNNPTIDREYLKKWIITLNLNTFKLF